MTVLKTAGSWGFEMKMKRKRLRKKEEGGREEEAENFCSQQQPSRRSIASLFALSVFELSLFAPSSSDRF
jgi:hypothetical protein